MTFFLMQYLFLPFYSDLWEGGKVDRNYFKEKVKKPMVYHAETKPLLYFRNYKVSMDLILYYTVSRKLIK